MAKRGLFGRIRDFFFGPEKEKPKPAPPPTSRPPRKVESPEQQEARLKQIELKEKRRKKALENRKKLEKHIEDLFGDAVDKYGNPNFKIDTVKGELRKIDDATILLLLEQDTKEEINDVIMEYKKETLHYHKAEPLFYH